MIVFHFQVCFHQFYLGLIVSPAFFPVSSPLDRQSFLPSSLEFFLLLVAVLSVSVFSHASSTLVLPFFPTAVARWLCICDGGHDESAHEISLSSLYKMELSTHKPLYSFDQYYMCKMISRQMTISRPATGCRVLHGNAGFVSRLQTASRRSSAFCFRVRASDDDDMVPILSGRKKSGFTEKDYEQLRNPKLLGGATIGEELAILRERHEEAERRAHERAMEHHKSANWDGDVYVGGRWNTLSVLYLIFLLTPLAIGLFAWLSYGKLWGVTPGLW